MAQLLGYDTYADYVLVQRMATNTANVYRLLDDLIEAYKPTAVNEMEEIEQMARRHEGDDFKLEPWDIELRRADGPSYAIDTVRAAEARFPGATFFYVIGEDNIAGLPRWKDWETLKTRVRFVSYPRTRESSTEIRRRLVAGEPIADLVPPCVAARLEKRKGRP